MDKMIGMEPTHTSTHVTFLPKERGEREERRKKEEKKRREKEGEDEKRRTFFLVIHSPSFIIIFS